MQDAELQRWTDAQSLLDEVLESPGPETVTRVRTRASMTGCQAELDALLDALETSSALDAPLDAAIQELAAPRMQVDALAGKVFGRWTLGKEIGRGGMSVVYHAQRTGDGFEQRAALKILSLSFASQAMLDGFLRERQILSELQHPGIARLIDGGITPEGSPWLVMEYVDGQRIDHWCRANNPDVRAVVRLVMELSQAVAHAQRLLVVHRDINASNVLVNERGWPVLIDFGIAGLLGDGGGRTMHAFTPTFAAPEQVAGERSTTATDVFAIGRLLASLLPAGTADRDLALLVDVATSADPERRYANARNLAVDLEAWLDKRPMQARSPTLRYRAGRFVARNRLVVAVGSLLLLSIVSGLVVSLWQARIAAAERDLARAESARALQATEFLKDLFRASDPDRAQGQAVTARDLLDQGAHQVRNTLETTPELRAEMLILLGDLYRELGEIDAAEPLLREGLQLADATGPEELQVDARRALAAQLMDAGTHEEALEIAEQGEQLLLRAGKVPGRQHASLMHSILFSLAELGRAAEAAERGARLLPAVRSDPDLPESALFDYLYSVANVMQIAERSDDAETLLREAASIDFEAVGDPTTQMNLHSNLAGLLDRKGELDAMLEHRLAANAIAERVYPPGHVQHARILSNLGSSYNKLGRYEEAVAAMEQALAIYDQVYGDEANPRVAAALNNFGRALTLAGQYRAAEPYLTRVRVMARSLFGPEDPRFAIATANLGDLQRQLGHFDEADALLTENLEVRIAAFGPEHRMVGTALGSLAQLRLDQARFEEALRFSDQALALSAQTGESSPRVLMTIKMRRAIALAGLARDEEAERVFSEAIRMGESDPGEAGGAWPDVLAAHAEFLVSRSDPGAATALERALKVMRDTQGAEHPDTRRIEELAAKLPS